MAPNCTLKANLKRPISQATKSEIGPYKLINKKKRPELAGLTEKILKANKDGQLHLLLIKLLTESIRLNLFITLNINYLIRFNN